MKRLVSSESVTEGHPDKICDQISDAILDAMLEQDPNSRVAVEAVATTGLVHIVGEVSTEAYVEIPQIVRAKLQEIGYTSSEIGFDAKSCGVLVSIGQQSPDISQGVDRSGIRSRHNDSEAQIDELGAGDQGIMFGYATDETDALFPLAPLIAHRLAEKLAEVRKNGVISGLRPDGKTQVSIEFEDDVPKRVDNVLISTQHDDDKNQEVLKAELKRNVVDPVLEEVLTRSQFDFEVDEYKLLVNPTGRFVIGGPQGDAGLTGRKIIIDTYGGAARHGGGAFSGKDPSKVDRSAAYMLRYIAKNIVAAKLARRVELQAAYAIGVSEPVGLYVDTFGTANVDESGIEEAVRQVFDLRPAAILSELKLLDGEFRFQDTAKYGHFGRQKANFPWERTDKVDELRQACK